MDEPLVQYDGSTTTNRTFLIADERGSIIAGTDNSGAKSWINTYDEFGMPGPGNQCSFQYTGQVWMASAGLYHFKARAYHPELGQFLQPDPIGYADGLNIYAYVQNDPVNRIDPNGTTSESFGFTCAFDQCEKGVVVDPNTGYYDWEAMHQNGIFAVVTGLGGTITFGELGQVLNGEDFHFYEVVIPTLCDADTAFALMRSLGASAPGPILWSSEGEREHMLFGWGNDRNLITQAVDSDARRITNFTLEGHRYFPGEVSIEVEPWGIGGAFSTIRITGFGTGPRPRENEILGSLYFGSRAAAASRACSYPGVNVAGRAAL
jgi:RHS repeat-associated protein